MVNDNNDSGLNSPIKKSIESLEKIRDHVESSMGQYRKLYHNVDSALIYLNSQDRLLSQGAHGSELYYASANAMASSGSSIEMRFSNINSLTQPHINDLIDQTDDIVVSGYAGYQTLYSEIHSVEGIPSDINDSEPSPPDTTFNMNQLVERVGNIQPSIAKMVEGAIKAIDRNETDSIRQAAHSMRESLTHLMDILAPEDDIKKAVWYNRIKTSKTGVSRRQRLIYIALGAKAKQDAPTPDEINLVATTLDSFWHLNSNAHRLESLNREVVKKEILLFAQELYRLLQLHDRNMN